MPRIPVACLICMVFLRADAVAYRSVYVVQQHLARSLQVRCIVDWLLRHQAIYLHFNGLWRENLPPTNYHYEVRSLFFTSSYWRFDFEHIKSRIDATVKMVEVCGNVIYCLPEPEVLNPLISCFQSCSDDIIKQKLHDAIIFGFWKLNQRMHFLS